MGFDSGSATRTRISISLAPSISAASNRLLEIASMEDLVRNVPMAT